jgi:hypothetical protein
LLLIYREQQRREFVSFRGTDREGGGVAGDGNDGGGRGRLITVCCTQPSGADNLPSSTVICNTQPSGADSLPSSSIICNTQPSGGNGLPSSAVICNTQPSGGNSLPSSSVIFCRPPNFIFNTPWFLYTFFHYKFMLVILTHAFMVYKRKIGCSTNVSFMVVFFYFFFFFFKFKNFYVLDRYLFLTDFIFQLVVDTRALFNFRLEILFCLNICICIYCINKMIAVLD